MGENLIGTTPQENRPAGDWDRLLLAYFHDPIDKAQDIPGHERRAARYAARALA